MKIAGRTKNGGVPEEDKEFFVAVRVILPSIMASPLKIQGRRPRQSNMSNDQSGRAKKNWRTYLPHIASPKTQLFRGRVIQFIGGRHWSLCLITQIESAKITSASGADNEIRNDN